MMTTKVSVNGDVMEQCKETAADEAFKRMNNLCDFLKTNYKEYEDDCLQSSSTINLEYTGDNIFVMTRPSCDEEEGNYKYVKMEDLIKLANWVNKLSSQVIGPSKCVLAEYIKA